MPLPAGAQKADVTILGLQEAALNIVKKSAHHWSGRIKKCLVDIEVRADLHGSEFKSNSISRDTKGSFYKYLLSKIVSDVKLQID